MAHIFLNTIPQKNFKHFRVLFTFLIIGNKIKSAMGNKLDLDPFFSQRNRKKVLKIPEISKKPKIDLIQAENVRNPLILPFYWFP